MSEFLLFHVQAEPGTLTLTCSRSPMRREGGTTLTSLTSVSAIARRRFSLLLPFGYACREKNGK